MTCEQARALVSASLDEALPPGDAATLDEHLAGCADCRAYAESILGLRRYFRFEAVEEVPDVTHRVLAEIGGKAPHDPRIWLRAAAVFVAFAVAGATFFGIARRTTEVTAADVPGRVLQAQRHLTTLTADLAVVERNWHPDLPERRYTGTLAYVAPESIRVALTDVTGYPSDAWVPNHTEYVATEGIVWWRGPAPCPAEAQPGCTPQEPAVTAVVGTEPFPAATPLPLDLVVPARSFDESGMLRPLGSQVIDGRTAVGVRVTVAQLDPLLAGLRRAGNWRTLHPTDEVELWLDEEALVPLALAVFPAAGADRASWAARNGYAADDPASPILEAAWRSLAIDGGVAEPFPSPPAEVAAADAGFRAGPAEAPTPALLSGLAPYRAGTVQVGTAPPVAVRTWSDGRAWLKVAATTGWPGGRLFGDLGDVVRRVDVEGAGTVYVSVDSRRVALHGDGIDVVVTGSVTGRQLLAAATSLGVTGLPVPAGWAEAATATLDEARAALPGLLAAEDLDGFAPPTVRVADGVVTVGYAGPGRRGVQLVASAGELRPPLEADVRGVTVREAAGRYSPVRGILEWAEDGVAYSLRSDTLTLDELVEIAAGLAP